MNLVFVLGQRGDTSGQKEIIIRGQDKVPNESLHKSRDTSFNITRAAKKVNCI